MPVGVVGDPRLGPLPDPVIVHVREAAPPPGEALGVEVGVEILLSCLNITQY